jgi:hypothetical protein
LCFRPYRTGRSGRIGRHRVVGVDAGRGLLAHERGRSQRRWVYVAAIIGPLAIPLLYFIAAVSGLRRADSNSRRRA